MRLNEINHLAQKSNVTVCSLNDFKSIVSSLGINDGNVEKYVGKYCFIEIGSGWGRIEAETPIAPAEFDSNGNEYDAQGFYSQGQWYFSNEHPNVIKLEFDDNQKFNNKKDNTMTAVKLRPEETRGGVKGATFYYKGGQDFTTEIANRLKTFVDNNLSYGNNVHFIIHCKQGKSRSAAIGSYVARKINQFTDEFLSEYDDEENGVSQFNMGVGRKGEPKYPHQNVMNRMGDLEGWNKSKDVKDQWWYNTIRQHPKTGYEDKRKEWELQRAEKNKVAENNNRNMKKVRLTESKLRGMIREAVKNILKETRDRFDSEKFYEWEENTHIPQDVMNMVNHIADKIGCNISEEETITLRNRGGWAYGWGKGFTFSYCTSSYADGPGIDYSSSLKKWLKGLGFRIENSYGDNGMDYTTNYNDTYWTYEFIYEPSIVYEEQFMIWGDEEYDNDGLDDYDGF